MAELLCGVLSFSYVYGNSPLLRSGNFKFNFSGPSPAPSDVCRFKWQSGVQFISNYVDEKGNLARHGGAVQQSKLLVVHIGKTAGSSLLKLLRDARVSYNDIHLFSVRDKVAELYDDIVITIRDPLERTISAFNWDNPWAVSGRLHKKKLFSHFYNTFPDINLYAGNLSADSSLGELARRAEGHIALDTCYYVGGIVEILKRHPSTFVIDRSSFTEDVLAVSKRLGWGITDVLSSFPPEINKVKKDDSKVTLSAKGAEELKAFLHMVGEYPLYYDLSASFRISA